MTTQLDKTVDAAPRSAMVRSPATWALYLMLALFAYLETSIGPAMPFVRDHLEIGYTVASLHFSAFATGAIFAGLFGDRIVTQIGRRSALWGGLIGMVAGILLFAISPMPAGSMAGVFLMGLIGTFHLTSNQSSLSDLHGSRRTIAITESNIAASCASVLAPLAIGGFDSLETGWQTAVYLSVPALAGLGLVFGRTTFPEAPPAVQHANVSSKLPRLFWIYWTVLFLAMSIEWCVAYWGADFLDSVAGMSKAGAATSMSVFFVAMVAGRTLGARLARKRPGPQLLIGALVVALVGFPIFWLAPQPAINLAGLFVAGFGIANFYPLTVAVATGVAADRPDAATSRLAIAGGIALLTLPLIVGLISDAVGMRWGFGIVVPLLAGAIICTIMAIRLSNQQSTPRLADG